MMKYETLGGYNSDGRACDVITLTDPLDQEFILEIQDSKYTKEVEKHLEEIIKILKEDYNNYENNSL